jgi:hypothetical protein
MQRIAILRPLAGLLLVSQPAFAATLLPKCADTDISSTSAPVNTPFPSTSCEGFYAGNLLGNSAADKTAQVSALNTLLGSTVYSTATFNFGSFDSLGNLNGSRTIDFARTLSGLTLIGVHYGAGANSPSDVAGNAGKDKSDSTAFYLFNAGTNLSQFYLTYGASSNAVLYQTKPAGPVPEPATWAMMLAGFGAIGWALRVKRAMAGSLA